MAGKWYALLLLNFGIATSGLNCFTDTFQLNPDASVNYTFSNFYSSGQNRIFSTPLDIITFQKGRLVLPFLPPGNDIFVYKTDYDNYLIWSNCITQGNVSFQDIEVAVRSSSSFSSNVMINIIRDLRALNFTEQEFRKIGFVDRSNCTNV
jgi:hypothetical protein